MIVSPSTIIEVAAPAPLALAEVLALLHESGMLRFLQPKRWGGYEMDLGAFYEIQLALAEASRLAPENADIAFRLALTCDALGDQEQARTAYARTMMLAPGSWQTWFPISEYVSAIPTCDDANLGSTFSAACTSAVPRIP